MTRRFINTLLTLCIATTYVVISNSVGFCAELARYEFSAEKMGVPVRILLYAESEEQANAAADSVWERFDDLNAKTSDYDVDSEIIQVCRKTGESGEPVQIGDDLRAVLEYSRRFCELTDGAFDITVSPIVKLWRRSRYFHQRPPESVLSAAKKLVGNGVWTLDDAGVTAEKNVRFDVGGIAKGYALDEALRILQERGIDRALIDASGDLRIGNPPPGKEGWNVGIASLNDKPACFCVLANVGICCSGDANRYLEIDGVRYSHIIDPRDGEPLTRRCVSAVLAPNATIADALASSLCVLGGEDFAKVAERVKTNDLGAGETTEPIEFLTIQVKLDAEPPYTDENTDVYATPFFQKELEKIR